METTTTRDHGPLRALAAFFVHSNLFISIAATSVALATMLLADLPPEILPLFIVFAATLFVYSLNRLTDIEEDAKNLPRRTTFTERYGGIFFAGGAVLYLGSIGVAFTLGLPGAPFLVLPIFAAALYSLFRVKRLLLVKNLIVGISWGIVPLGVGVYYGVVRTPEILVIAAIFTIMLTVAAAVFDIKDIKGDKREGIRTVPIVLGPRATRIGALAVTVAVAAAVLAVVATGIVPRTFLAFLAFLAYVAGYIPFASEDRGPLFYGFVIDGEHVFFALVVIALEFLRV